MTTYEYDAVGNRVKMTEGGVVTTYDYNGLNQLEKADTTDAEIEYTYDERGNQVLESNTTTEETVETTYNVAGEMVQLVKKSGSTTTLTQTNVYNQDGIRISRTQGDTEREYYYNNGVVAYTEDNNSLSSANIQNDDGSVIGTYRGSTYYNYLKNMQGSTESIISETGTTAAVYTYSDFGETEEVVADTIDNEICYTGAVYDKDTGLYYMNARYYDAETGRFISQDSYRGEIDDAGTWHLYAYCANDPINYVDPTGHSALAIAVKGISMIFGSVSVGAVAPFAAVCVGAFLAIKGYQKWGATIKKKVDKAVFNTALGTIVASTYSAEFIKGISISIAKAKVATKKGKDEKHHIVPQTAKSTENAKAALAKVGIHMDSNKNTVMLDYRLHRKTYYTYINKYIPKNPCKYSNVASRLSKIKKILKTASDAVKSV